MRRQRHHAAVNLGDGALLGTGVFLLDDGLHRRALAHDAAVATRIGKIDRQQGQLVATAGGNQITQGLGADQWHIAREHDHDAVVAQHRYSLLHGVTGAELRLLAHETQVKTGTRCRCQRRLHFCRAVADDHHHLAR